MSIVLKENEWAKKMISEHNLGNKPSETLRRVARYYLDSGDTPSVVRKKMELFLLQCNPVVSLPKWSDIIDYALKKAKEYKAIDIEHIYITDNEIDTINKLEGKQLRRLAFTLLCLAKYWHIVCKGSDYWVNNKDTEIMSMANVNTSIKRQGIMYWTLNQQGLIQFSKKVDNTNIKVLFVQDGEPILDIQDFRNLGYQYQMYCGEPYFKCANCGLVTKELNPEVGRKQKYCKKCANEIALQQKVNSAMRRNFGKR